MNKKIDNYILKNKNVYLSNINNNEKELLLNNIETLRHL